MRAVRILLLSCAATLVAAGGWLWWSPNAAAPPLLAGLPKEFAAAERMFDERVRSRFPEGTADSEIRAALERQGFVLSVDEGGVRRQALREERGWVCLVRASVFWRLDPAGGARDLSGRYGAICL